MVLVTTPLNVTEASQVISYVISELKTLFQRFTFSIIKINIWNDQESMTRTLSLPKNAIHLVQWPPKRRGIT
jgi:hypothetical protein